LTDRSPNAAGKPPSPQGFEVDDVHWEVVTLFSEAAAFL
jgi:hypothetical protein